MIVYTLFSIYCSTQYSLEGIYSTKEKALEAAEQFIEDYRPDCLDFNKQIEDDEDVIWKDEYGNESLHIVLYAVD